MCCRASPGCSRGAAFNIVSLAVSPTDDERFSRMTIVVDAESAPLEQVVKQLNKLIPVIKITELPPRRRCRARADDGDREGDGRSAEAGHRADRDLRGKIVDVGFEALTIMVAGEPDKLDAFSDLVKPFGIVELQRTGRIALPRVARQPDPAAGRQDRPRLACTSAVFPERGVPDACHRLLRQRRRHRADRRQARSRSSATARRVTRTR